MRILSIFHLDKIMYISHKLIGALKLSLEVQNPSLQSPFVSKKKQDTLYEDRLPLISIIIQQLEVVEGVHT